MSFAPARLRRRSWWPRLRRGPLLGGPGRIVGLDAARGLAIVGMIIAHAAHVAPWGEDPRALLGIAHGHSSILFAVIAGVSLAITTGGTTPPAGQELVNARLRVFVRSLGLLVLSSAGLAVGTDVAIILAPYALWFVWMIPFLRTRPRLLLLLGGWHLFLGFFIQRLVMAALNYSPVDFETPEGGVLQLTFLGVYPAVIWVGFVFVGMAVGRAGLRNTTVLVRMAVGGAIAAVVVSLPFIIETGSLGPWFGPAYGREIIAPHIEDPIRYDPDDYINVCYDANEDDIYPCSWTEFQEEQEMDPDTAERVAELTEHIQEWPPTPVLSMYPHKGTPFETYTGCGLALVLLAGLVWLCRHIFFQILLSPLALVGSMALTSYLLHLVGLVLMPMEWDQDTRTVVLLLGVTAFASLWRLVFTTGPFENLISTLAWRSAVTREELRRPADAD